MTITDCLELLGVIATCAAFAWAVCSWFLDKKLENDKEIEALKKKNQDQTNEDIKSIIFDMKQKMHEIEILQNNMSAATMKQFHQMELAMKDYSKDIQIQSEHIKQQKLEMDKIWKTFVEEIAPGVFRVSEKKK